MKNIIASVAALSSASQFLCIFCCVVPTATGVIAVLASLGLAGAETNFFLSDLSIKLHPWQPAILGISLSLIAFSWSMWFYNNKKVTSECGCKVKRSFFLPFATLLIGFNSISYLFMH